MIITIENLLSSLRKHQLNNNLYKSRSPDNGLTVFLHTSVAVCDDCNTIQQQIISYYKSDYNFAITEDALNEIKYLAKNKKSLFRKNAEAIYKAYSNGYIKLMEYNNHQLKETAVLCPSLPFAFRLQYRGNLKFKYLVTLADYKNVVVIVDGDKQVCDWIFASKGSVESTCIKPVGKYVCVGNHKVRLKNKKYINGGEATLHKYWNKLIKVYHNGNMTNAKLQKIQQLMSLANRNKKIKKIICVPTSIAKDIKGNACGIVLPHLKKHKTLNQVLAKGISSKKCRYLLKLYLLRIFELNLMSIVVSDINLSNVLCHKNDIVLIDADSFQIGSYPAGCYRQDLLDNPMYENLENIDRYVRGIKSDILYFTSIVFTLLVGVKPTRYKDSTEFSNFITHPFLYRNSDNFFHEKIIDEALENWNENLTHKQKDLFTDVFLHKKYISHASIDKCLFG